MSGHPKGALLLLFSLFALTLSAQKEDSTYYYTPLDSVLLNDVKVVAYRTRGKLHTIPGSISVIGKERLIPSDGTNLATTLNAIPGVSMQSGTYLTGRIVIRGMGSRTPYNTNRIRAYLNDIPITSSDGVSTPEELDLLNLGKIELIKGPSSALYGSGLGGSINMSTPEYEGNNIEAGLQYGSFKTLKAGVSGTWGNERINIRTSLGHTDSEGFRENNSFRRTSLVSAASITGKKLSADMTLMLLDVNGGIPSSLGKTMFETTPEAAAPSWKAAGGYKEFIKGLMAVSLTAKLNSDLSGSIMLFGRMNDNFEHRPFNDLDDMSSGGGIRGKIEYRSGKAEITTGIDLIRDQYGWKLLDGPALLNENREHRNHMNIFGVTYYKPNQKLNISVASALNYISYDLTDLYPGDGDQSGKRKFPLIYSPRMGLNYSPFSFLAFYASAGHGFSLPSPEETLLPAGNINHEIKPEQGWQIEAGSRINLNNERIRLDAALYSIELQDLLVTKRITEDIFTGVNAGRTRHQGFELSLAAVLFRYDHFPGELISDFGLTSSVNRFIDFTDGGVSYDGKRLPGIPEQTTHMQVRWRPESRSEISISIQYTGDQYVTDDNLVSYDGYLTGNMKVTKSIRIKGRSILQIYGGVNNFTDERYASMLIVNAIGFNNSEPRYYYPGIPRSYFSGIRISF